MNYDTWKATEPEPDWHACPKCGNPLHRDKDGYWYCERCDDKEAA